MVVIGNISKTDIKITKVFTGVRAELTLQITKLLVYFRTYEGQFRSETTKVLFAASNIDGKAFKQFNNYLEDYLSKPALEISTETKALIGSFTEFRKIVQKLYGDGNIERAAVRKIYYVRQVGSVRRYVTEFIQHAYKIGQGKKALIDYFYRGLKDYIKDKIYKRYDEFNTVDEIVNEAKLVDNRYYERLLETKGARVLNINQNRNPVTPRNRGDLI